MNTLKITAVEVFNLNPPPPGEKGTPPNRDSWRTVFKQANPRSKYDLPIPKREPGDLIWVKITADDGTWGLGCTDTGNVAAVLIRECLAPIIIGEEVGAIDRCNDRLWRGTLSYGNEGLTARAIAGIDLALWDLWGKVLDQPVYRLAGGPARSSMDVYITGNDVDWGLELGFQKFKLARPHGVYDGQAGIDATVDLIAKTREQIGPKADLMLDCWMAYDVDYAVRMCEALRPYRMAWMEEMLMPHDWRGLKALRQRVPWQTMATGEHWSTRWPGIRSIEDRLVDLIQADIHWIGGFTEAIKLAHAADAAGIPMCLHTGANSRNAKHTADRTFPSIRPRCSFRRMLSRLPLRIWPPLLSHHTGNTYAKKRQTRPTSWPRFRFANSRRLVTTFLTERLIFPTLHLHPARIILVSQLSFHS